MPSSSTLQAAPKKYWLLRGWWEVCTPELRVIDRLPSFFALRLALFHLDICQPYYLVRRGSIWTGYRERARVGFFVDAKGRHWMQRTQHKGVN